MFQFQLRTLFVLAAVCASPLGGWRLFNAFMDVAQTNPYNLEWTATILGGASVVLVAVVLIHGQWRIVPWVVIGIVAAHSIIALTFPWPFRLDSWLLSAACSSGPAALLGSILLIRWDARHPTAPPAERRDDLLLAAPWLCLFPALGTVGFFVHGASLQLAKKVANATWSISGYCEHLLSFTFVALFAVVLIHGGWRVVPWCLAGFVVSSLLLALVPPGTVPLTATAYGPLLPIACGAAALAGGVALIRQHRKEQLHRQIVELHASVFTLWLCDKHYQDHSEDWA